MILVCCQGKPFNITVMQVYAPTSNVEEAKQFYEDLKGLLELTPKKDVLFIIGDWNAKVGSQEIPGLTAKLGLGVQNEAGQRVLPRECTGPSKHHLLTTQEKTTHGYHQTIKIEIKLITLFTALDLASITSHIHSWVLLLFWLHPFILSRVISTLISSSIWAPTDLGSSSFSILSFCLFILLMGFSRQEY